MKIKNISQSLAMTLSLLSLGLLLSSTALFAADEDSMFADFQKSAASADPKLAAQAAMRDHPHAPTNQDVEKLAAAVANAAVTAMDRGTELEKRYPESQYLPSVRSKLAQTLSTVFGLAEYPVPPERAAELEGCIRALLARNKSDFGLGMGLCNVAKSLPAAKQLALYQELSGGSAIPPVRARAKQALLDLERVGKPLDLSFTALDGRKVDMKELKGKVVIVDFWATECLPCCILMPALKELYTKHKSQGLEVIGVSLDSDKEKLTRFLQKKELPWPQYFDAAGEDSPVAKAFGIRGIPVVWLVDRQGLLRHLDARFGLEGKVESLLKEQP